MHQSFLEKMKYLLDILGSLIPKLQSETVGIKLTVLQVNFSTVL